MALSLMLQNEGLKAESIDTTCTISLKAEGDGFAIKRSHLELKAKIPGASQEAFNRAANNAKEGCPVSKLFDTEITLNAQLEN